jgi:hypothetical protein
MPSAKDLVKARGVVFAIAGALILIAYIIARLRGA